MNLRKQSELKTSRILFFGGTSSATGFGRFSLCGGLLVFQKDVLGHGFYESKRLWRVGIVTMKGFFTQRCAKGRCAEPLNSLSLASQFLKPWRRKATAYR